MSNVGLSGIELVARLEATTSPPAVNIAELDVERFGRADTALAEHNIV